MSSEDQFPSLLALASRQRVARIVYLKAGAAMPTGRLVEPYSLKESAAGDVSIYCWQVDPPPVGRSGWRMFRVDRIVTVEDGGIDFSPRIPISCVSGEVRPISRGATSRNGKTPEEAYLEAVENALWDFELSIEEEESLRPLQVGISTASVRAIHARVFANVLEDALSDGSLSAAEEGYLAGTRAALLRLGWCP